MPIIIERPMGKFSVGWMKAETAFAVSEVGMKAKSFCYLESDQKTYKDFLSYYCIFGAQQHSFDIDMLIQKREIETHLASHALSSHDQDSVCNWINHYSSGFRSYLNSLKMVAMFQYYHDKSLGRNEDPSFEIFCDAVSFWNREKINTVDTIFI